MVHSFDTEVAKRYGILEAAILWNLAFWIQKNKANRQNFHDGCYWTYNSASAFSELFDYASKKQIERALKHLRDEGVLKTANFNKEKWDRTLWYSINEELLPISSFREMDVTKSGNGCYQTGAPIPDNKPDIKPDISTTVTTVPLTDRFSEFWSLYPKKVGKQAALRAWKRIKPNDELSAKIITALSNQKKWEQWTRDNGRYIPNPSTWLNQGRWEDEQFDSTLSTEEPVKPNSPAAPRFEEIFSYVMERGISVDLEAFFSYWKERSWMDGESPVDWKQKLKEWE